MNSPAETAVTLRIIDANFNRATEGLRVVEEYVRFGLDDAHLTLLCKQMRHDLTAALAALEATEAIEKLPAELAASRDTRHDVGAAIQVDSEYQRDSLAALWQANLKRVQQSLRCLEEYAKTLGACAAKQFEAVRYQAYNLEKAVAITSHSREFFAELRLYVLIDGRASTEEFVLLVESLIAAGVHVLQLRDKSLDDRQLLQRARLLREKTRGSSTLFIMNDRADLAVLSQADGVHLGQDELSVADARRIVGPRAIIGVSTHSLEQARQAVLDGANYIGVGPTFPSQTKSFEQFPGLDLARQVAREIALPAFAIGGITLDNLDKVLETGIGRIAVRQSVVGAADPKLAATTFLARLTPPTPPPPPPRSQAPLGNARP